MGVAQLFISTQIALRKKFRGSAPIFEADNAIPYLKLNECVCLRESDRGKAAHDLWNAV